jgi:squalene synthase HpnC
MVSNLGDVLMFVKAQAQSAPMQRPPPAAQAAPVTHYENFPVASWLCPPHLRAPIAAIYHFARTADDLADEGEVPAAQRLADLQSFRQGLERAAQGAWGSAATVDRPDSAPPAYWAPIFVPLQWAIGTYQLPVQLLHDLLDAFVQDIEKTRDHAGYADDAELLDYCRRSANPVGRLLLHLYGVHHATALQQSDAICTALQLINFWQDLSVDIPRGRFYLSDAARARFGVPQADVLALRQTEDATQLIASCADYARASMLKGAPLVHQLPGRAGWELRLVVQGGLRILDKIAALNYSTLAQRPTLRWWDFPLLIWRAARMRA